MDSTDSVQAAGFLIGYAIGLCIYFSGPVFIFLCWLRIRKMQAAITRVEKEIKIKRCG